MDGKKDNPPQENWAPPSFDEHGEAAQPPAIPHQGFHTTLEGLGGAPAAEGFHPGDTGPAHGDEPDFAAIRFQRENTLLTNAEDYAKSVREEAEIYVRRLREEVELLNVEAENRYAEAAQAKAGALEEADKRISAAQAQVEKIKQEAYEEGFAQGKELGMEKRYKEAQVYIDRLAEVAAEMENFRRNVAYYAEKDAVRLAVLMAKKILRQELKVNPSAVLNLLSRTLAEMEGTGLFKVWLNPEDHEFISSAREELMAKLAEGQNLSLGARASLGPGEIQIETDRHQIDLTFKSQFHHIDSVLNQALAERETMVLNRPPSAIPPLGDEEEPQPEAAHGQQNG